MDSGDYVLVDVRPKEISGGGTPAGATSAPLFQKVDWSKPSFSKFLRAGALMANGVTPVRLPCVQENPDAAGTLQADVRTLTLHPCSATQPLCSGCACFFLQQLL